MSARTRKARPLLALVLLLSAVVASAASRQFDVPAGAATQGLTRFAQQAGVPVLFPFELLQERRTRELRGRHEIHAGLRTLLEGSGLVAYVNNRGQISIQLAEPRPAPAEREEDQTELIQQALRLLGAEESLPEVTVTGTRITRDGMTTPTPVAFISSEELALLGPGPLVDALNQLPHFLNNDTPQTQSFGTSGAAGASHLNLRGIGSIRSLTLLDGRRVVPSTRLGTIDIALLPRNLVQRVEVVTGGASAAYGSDAVSGMVNLILDSDLRGLRGHAHSGLTELGDNRSVDLGVAFGTHIGEQSSLLLAAEFMRARGIRGYASRSWFDSQAAIVNPDPAGPAEIIARNVHATGYTYGGLITSGPLAGIEFLPGGVPAPFERGELYTRLTQSGGGGADPAADMVWILPDQQRQNIFARLTTQPTAALSAFVQLLGAQTRNHFDKDPPSLWGSWEATIFQDNAFLPESLRQRMVDEQIDSFRLGRVGADGELGRSTATQSGELLTGTAGIDWHLQDWSLQGHYQYGRNLTQIRYEDVVRLDRVYRAIDSVVDPLTGRTTCRSTLSFPDDGCVPLNLFGRGSASAQARDWITEGSSTQWQDVRQQTAEATVRGDVPWLAASRLSIATGAAWRAESADNRLRRFPDSLDGLRVEPDHTQGYRGLPTAYSDTANIFERTLNVNVAGRYHVWETFGEVLAPMLEGLPLVQRLDLHAALRYARYSGSGPVTAWKLGLDWQFAPSLRLRATQSRDIRAGSLSERYDSATAGLTIVDRVQEGDPIYAVVVQREGDSRIEPEKADTTTAGFVLQPRQLPGLSLAADYYDIRIDNAIALYGAQNIIDACADGDAALCALIERSDTGSIRLVRNRILNIAQARTRGVDLELSWRRAVDWLGGGESIAMRLFANRTFQSSTTDASGNFIDRAGQTGLFGGAPRFQVNVSLAYERAPLRLALQQRHISSGSYDATYSPGDIDRPHVRSASYTALHLEWKPPAARGARFYLNVQNVFDQDPPIAPDWGFGGSIPTNEGLFDVLGRRFVAGVRFEFEDYRR